MDNNGGKIVLSDWLTKMHDFTSVPNSILSHPDISNRAFRLWVVLHSFHFGVNGKIFPGMEKLAETIHMSKSTVFRAIKELEELGLVSVKHRGFDETNEYTLYVPQDLIKPGNQTKPSNKEQSPGNDRSTLTDGCLSDMTEEENRVFKKTKKEKKNGTKEKKENESLKADCGYAASCLETKNEVTETTSENSHLTEKNTYMDGQAYCRPVVPQDMISSTDIGSSLMPDSLFRSRLAPRQKALWGNILCRELYEEDGLCSATNEVLAKSSSSKRGTISNTITKMVKAGAIKRIMIYGNGIDKIYATSWSENDQEIPIGFNYIGRKLFTVSPEHMVSKEPSKCYYAALPQEESRAGGRNTSGWKKDVFVRDNYTCQKCGKRGGSLIAHHIDGYASNEELRTELSNGITLCKKHHAELHRLYGHDVGKENLAKFMEDDSKDKKEQEC